MAWIDAAKISEGHCFGRPPAPAHWRQSAGAGVSQILKRLLKDAGLGADYGAPLPAAMRLSLHKSTVQAQQYYDDVDVADNPTADLLGD